MSSNLNRRESVREFDAKLSLADFVVGDSDDPLIPPLAFTQWRQAGAWEASIYEPEMLATADARTIINYEGRPRSVVYVTHDIEEAVLLTDRVMEIGGLRPAPVRGEVAISLPRPRTKALRREPRFHDLVEEVRSLLKTDGVTGYGERCGPCP